MRYDRIVGGSKKMLEPQPKLIVEYKNKRPIELLDLTASLAAFGDQFQNFSADVMDAPAKLFVREMRPGSIIAELVGALEKADLFIQQMQSMAGFMTHWQELLQAVLQLSPPAKDAEKREVRAARSFVQPIVNDEGSQLNIIASDGATIINNFNLSSHDGRQIHVNATHLLTAGLPDEHRFAREPMILHQMRDARRGDMGYIDRFSERPLKLTFTSDDLKRQILDSANNPFSLIYFVSGVVKTAGGIPAAFHIVSLDDIAPKEAA